MTKQIRSIKDEKEAWLKLLDNKNQPTKTQPTKNPKTLDLKKYRLSKNLRQAISDPNKPNFPLQSTEYTFIEILTLINNYVQTHHYIHIDPRNAEIVHCIQTPLERVFNVSAFHTSQLPNLLLPHLTSTEDNA